MSIPREGRSSSVMRRVRVEVPGEKVGTGKDNGTHCIVGRLIANDRCIFRVNHSFFTQSDFVAEYPCEPLHLPIRRVRSPEISGEWSFISTSYHCAGAVDGRSRSRLRLAGGGVF